MNLFVLDKDPTIAARMNCDKHVVKIILEAVEMLGYAYIARWGSFEPVPQISSIDRFPFRQHYKHPMSQWVRASQGNFNWTLEHLEALLAEYTLRYKKIHKYSFVPGWIKKNKIHIEGQIMTDWPRCFGDYKEKIPITSSAIEDYRRYYCLAKRSFARWTYVSTPTWFYE